jgi:hypothetical protein
MFKRTRTNPDGHLPPTAAGFSVVLEGKRTDARRILFDTGNAGAFTSASRARRIKCGWLRPNRFTADTSPGQTALEWRDVAARERITA